LVIASKILSRIVLDRIKSTLDSLLRDEQAGFRCERSCTDQIATLRIIIEQSLNGTVSSKNWGEARMPAFTYTFLSSARLGYQTNLRNRKDWYTVDVYV